jgi:hypothetical protein
MKSRIENIVKNPFYIGLQKVYSYSFYKDYSQYIFYDKNGWVIATINSDKEFDSENEVIGIFSDNAPNKRKEFMW